MIAAFRAVCSNLSSFPAPIAPRVAPSRGGGCRAPLLALIGRLMLTSPSSFSVRFRPPCHPDTKNGAGAGKRRRKSSSASTGVRRNSVQRMDARKKTAILEGNVKELCNTNTELSKLLAQLKEEAKELRSALYSSNGATRRSILPLEDSMQIKIEQ